jgi:hypothetical protein
MPYMRKSRSGADDAPPQNNPLSEVARDAHALLLGSFRVDGS